MEFSPYMWEAIIRERKSSFEIAIFPMYVGSYLSIPSGGSGTAVLPTYMGRYHDKTTSSISVMVLPTYMGRYLAVILLLTFPVSFPTYVESYLRRPAILIRDFAFSYVCVVYRKEDLYKKAYFQFSLRMCSIPAIRRQERFPVFLT